MKGVLTFTAMALLLAPLALGQAHDHGLPGGRSPVSVLIDVQDQDEIRTGDPARFAVVVFGTDGIPDSHQDLRIQVLISGRLLFETTPASGHDYDGINQFDVVFPTPGPYSVRVLDGAGVVLGSLDGWVLATSNRPASLNLEGPTTVAAGELDTFRIWPQDDDGVLVEHFYALLEVRRPGELTYRAKLHGHGGIEHGPIEAALAFPVPGAYSVEATVFLASPNGPQHIQYAPVHARLDVQVLPPTPMAALPTLPVSTEPTATVIENGTGDVRLVGTYDPAPQVSLATLQHLSVLAQTRDQDLVGHTDFSGRLVGPLGNVLFESRFMHESDSVLEFATTQPVPGAYRFTVSQADAASIDLPFQVAVAPPSLALPGFASVLGLEQAAAGVPGQFELALKDASGTPFQHAEVDVQIVGPDGILVLATKLHSHDDGRLPFLFAPLVEGLHTIRLVPFGLGPEPVVFVNDPASSTIQFQVASGQAWPAAQSPPRALPTVEEARVAPGSQWPLLAALGTLLVGLVATLVVFRRR